MDLDLRLVRYAVVLAEELHYARAAGRLHIAQQTLSAQINQLETRLGVALFARDRRHVELTPAGELFVHRGRGLLAGAQELLDELDGSAPPLRLDVITEGLTGGVVARELRTKMPEILIEVLQGQGLTATVPAVLEGRMDLAFGWAEGTGSPLPAGLGHQLVRWEPCGLVLPAGHPLAAYEEVPLRELVAYPLVVHTAEEAREWRVWNEEAIAAFGLCVGWRLHGHGRSSARAAALAYNAPAFGPVELPLRDGVVCRPLVEPVPLIPISVVWRSQGRTPERVRRAIAAIHEISAEHGWLTLPSVEHWAPAAPGTGLVPGGG